MIRKLSILAVLAGLALSAAAKTPVEPLLRQLDESLAQASTYEGYFLERVSVLRQVLDGKNTPAQEYEIRKKLAEEFSSYRMDSTVFHLNRNRAIARAMGDGVRQAETDFLLAREYAQAGYHSDALEILSGYRLEEIPESLEALFYEVSTNLYGELAAYSSNNAQYWQKRNMYRISLLPLLEEGSYEWYDYHRVQAEADRDKAKALDYAMQALEVTAPNSRQYARAAFFVSTYQEDPDEEIAWLARSAIADVMCATKDYASLNDLADKLYDRGDIERAFQYAADHCMPDALFFGGKLRPWQIAQFFPALENAYAAKNAHTTRQMWMLIAFSALELFLLVGILVFFVRLRKSESLMNILQTNQEQLLERLETNAALEREMVESFAQRQAELRALDQRLEERSAELRRLLEQAEGIVRSPHFLRELILNQRAKGFSAAKIAKNSGLGVDEVELILAQSGHDS